ncbi:hypothetical protein Rcae01_03835 [Novipirellula caenicola]|uniref:Uncharacterized protein n=1 Tax=Novipirellula caenicola TaxID=1536901 RepID=A0ABP9VT93_9BACT
MTLFFGGGETRLVGCLHLDFRVAELVKSFGSFGLYNESLDDFRYNYERNTSKVPHEQCIYLDWPALEAGNPVECEQVFRNTARTIASILPSAARPAARTSS